MERREQVNALKAIALNAGRGISQDPERYGNSLLDSLEYELQQFENKIPKEFWEEYTAKYISLYSSWMNAMSRCISSFITGASNFPVRRAQKNNDREHAARVRLDEWSAKVVKRLNRAEKLHGWQEIERLQNKIETLTELQENMKSANAIIRKKTLTEEEKHDEISALGFSDEDINDVLHPKYWDKKGFLSCTLTNNNAKIKQATERMEYLVKVANAEDASYDFDGGTIEVSAEDERIRIIFDERPERPMIENLKKNGFHWSPSNGAWQRQTTSNAKWAVKQLFKIDVK